MRKLTHKTSSSLGRLMALVAILALSTGLLTSAQPEPPPNGELVGLANEVINESSQALSQTLAAWTHASFTQIEDARASIHDAINSIVGPMGENFNADFGRPLGQGAIPAATRLLEGIRQLNIPPGSIDYVVAGENVVLFLNLAVERALIALDLMQHDVELASEELRLVQGMLMAARGSSEEKDRPTEGGARTIKAWLEDPNY